MTAADPQRQSCAPARGNFEPAIDLVHLARQTMGDSALEFELLEMFDRQSARIVEQLIETDRADAKAQADLAHKLRGSALALGARRVADAALAYEQWRRSGGPDGERQARALARAVAEARAEIGRLIQ